MNFRTILSIVAMCVMVAFVGCTKPDGTEGDSSQTSFKLATSLVEIDENGGEVEVKYTIKNHQQGAIVITSSESSWIKNLNVAGFGKIKFTVMPNYSDKEREAKIAVEYTAVEGVFEITVKQAPSSKAMFSYSVVSNEPSRLSLSVTPADLTTAYVCRAYTEDHIKAFGLETDEALAAYDMDAIDYEAYVAGQTLLNYLQNISHTGKAFDIEFTKLFPDTNYVVYCYHIDLKSGKRASDIYREVVRTAKPDMIDFNVDMTFNIYGAEVEQTIIPENKDQYYYAECWSVEDFYTYYGLAASFKSTFAKRWNENVVLMTGVGYQPYQIVESTCFKGDKVIMHNELKSSTEYVFYIFAVDKETGFVASDVIIEKRTTEKAHESTMTIDITVKDVFKTTANIYWKASDANGRFVRSYFTKAEFDSWGTTDEEKLETFYSLYGPISFVGETDMNAINLTPGTTYVAFAFGVNGDTPNTRIFKKEFTTLSDIDGMSNIVINYDTHYNMAELATVDAEHWGDYAEYENFALVPMSIDGVSPSDEVYILVTTMPLDYYNSDAEWLRDVAKEQNKVNCRSNYNYIAEYEKEYSVIAVAKDTYGNYGKLYKGEMYLYKSDSQSAEGYVYQANK